MASINSSTVLSPSNHEAQILQSYLLTPSSLPTVVPLATFTTLFPSQNRAHPHVKALYRDLQFLRSVAVDGVRENIERECARGDRSRTLLGWAVATEMGHVNRETGPRKRRRSSEDVQRRKGKPEDLEDEADKDVLLDTALLPSNEPSVSTGYGMVPRHSKPSKTHHTVPSLLSAMETASQDLEAEAEQAEREAEKILAEMRETVGAMSDLRYGKFARASGVEGGDGGVEVEVVKGLKGLVEICDRTTGMGVQG